MDCSGRCWVPSSAGKRAQALREAFRRVHAWARRRSRRVPPLRLVVGCPRVFRARRRDKRAFMHVGHPTGVVCTSPVAARLSVNHVVALFLHEIGHPLAMKLWGRSEQEDSDKSVRDILGVRLHYRGPLILQWVPDSVVRRILNDGRSS